MSVVPSGVVLCHSQARHGGGWPHFGEEPSAATSLQKEGVSTSTSSLKPLHLEDEYHGKWMTMMEHRGNMWEYFVENEDKTSQWIGIKHF